MISVRCFESLEAAGAIRDDVNALNRLAARPDPFSTFEFFETYLRHDEDFPAGRGVKVWFLAAFRNARLIGYLALKQVTRRTLGLRAVTVGFLVTHDTDRPHVVSRAEDLLQVSEAFYAHLLARRGEWSCLEFQQQDDSSSLFPPPAGADLKGCLLRQWTSLENCTIPVRWGHLADYFHAMSRKFRVNLGRQMRALLAEGAVELLTSSDPATTPALFELYLGIEAHSWKAEAKASIGRHPERIAYFRSLLDARQPMRVSIQILLLDGEPVAGLICGAFEAGLYALHIVYDDRLARLAPGSAMLLLGMRQAIVGRCEAFNLLSGFGYFKVRWLAQITPLRVAQIYRVGSLLYWRRVIGDFRRSVFSAALNEARVLFNPLRRSVGVAGRAPTEPAKGVGPPLAGAERQRIAALVAEARAGQGEFLSPAALMAVMPPEVQRAPRSDPAALY